MVEGWIVKIVTMSDKGKMDKISFMEYGSIYDCTRIVHSFRPKRGYKILKFEIERGATLV